MVPSPAPADCSILARPDCVQRCSTKEYYRTTVHAQQRPAELAVVVVVAVVVGGVSARSAPDCLASPRPIGTTYFGALLLL